MDKHECLDYLHEVQERKYDDECVYEISFCSICKARIIWRYRIERIYNGDEDLNELECIKDAWQLRNE